MPDYETAIRTKYGLNAATVQQPIYTSQPSLITDALIQQEGKYINTNLHLEQTTAAAAAAAAVAAAAATQQQQQQVRFLRPIFALIGVVKSTQAHLMRAVEHVFPLFLECTTFVNALRAEGKTPEWFFYCVF